MRSSEERERIYRKREEKEWEEREFIQKESLRLVKEIYLSMVDSPMYHRAMRDITKLMKIIENRERTDRCYYCHKGEGPGRKLGTETATDLKQCTDCADSAYSTRCQRESNAYQHYHDYGNFG